MRRRWWERVRWQVRCLLLRLIDRLDHRVTSRVEIQVDALGRGHIIVNGYDLSDRLRGFEVRARVGDLTTVRVELVPDHIRIYGDPDLAEVRS